ncbi:MAG: cytochrome b/b6 domain-containing protein, partial [Methylococcales bacterium]
MKVIHIWDLPLRLFHWLLAVAFVVAYVTAKFGGALMDWHGRIGIFVLGLLIFRVVWGFVGSTHARFSTFFPTFSRLLAYLKGRWQGVGHNPVGGLSVFALLTALVVQVSTGLFANDDIAFQGPLFDYVDKSLSDQLTGWHSRLFNGLLALVILHVLAIFFYRWVKKTNLLVPMLTGKKQVPKTLAEALLHTHKPRVGTIRFVLSVVISCTVVWGVSGGIAKLYPIQSPQQTAQA